jgi:hypothetical protein
VRARPRTSRAIPDSVFVRLSVEHNSDASSWSARRATTDADKAFADAIDCGEADAAGGIARLTVAFMLPGQFRDDRRTRCR